MKLPYTFTLEDKATQDRPTVLVKAKIAAAALAKEYGWPPWSIKHELDEVFDPAENTYIHRFKVYEVGDLP